MKAKDSYDEIFSDIDRILVVLAHPDDMEINCGGIIARLISDKKEVRLVVTTSGGKGTKDKEGIQEEDFGNSRINEQIEAGKVLGIPENQNFNLKIPDGELETSIENIGKIVFHIREFKPDLIITHNPNEIFIDFNGNSCWVNHRDHRNTAQITVDAVYPYSRDTGFFTDQLSQIHLETHTVTKLLIADTYTEKDVRYFKIDNFIEQKKNALKKHISAFSPDSVGDFIEENKYEKNYFEPLKYYKVY